MKIKAVILAFLLVGMITAAIGPVFAAPGIPPSPKKIPTKAKLPNVYDLVPDQAKPGLDIADSHAPDVVPPS